MAVTNQRKIREQLQREWPECFRPCPACVPGIEDRVCPQCAGTELVTVATAHLLSEGRLPEEEAA